MLVSNSYLMLYLDRKTVTLHPIYVFSLNNEEFNTSQRSSILTLIRTPLYDANRCKELIGIAQTMVKLISLAHFCSFINFVLISRKTWYLHIKHCDYLYRA